MFSMKPEHSKWSHAADALRTSAVGYEEPLDAADMEASDCITRFSPIRRGADSVIRR
jgi:hypothetical protein